MLYNLMYLPIAWYCRY